MARIDELSGPGRRSTSRRGALLLCVTGVLLAHLALLSLGSAALRELLHAKLLRNLPVKSMVLQVRQLSTAPEHPAELQLAPLAQPAPVAPAPEPLAPVAEEPQAAPQPPGGEPPIYVPRALLTVAPVARAPVLLQWPPNWPSKVSYSAVLKLYLDEQGRVERVQVDGEATLPEPLLEVARQAFTAAGFTPGQLNGQAVKSWIRVEVNFETEDLSTRR